MVVCSVTVLARLFGSGHHRQVERRPSNAATSTRTFTQSMARGVVVAEGWGYWPQSSLKRQIARLLNNQKDATAYE